MKKFVIIAWGAIIFAIVLAISACRKTYAEAATETAAKNTAEWTFAGNSYQGTFNGFMYEWPNYLSGISDKSFVEIHFGRVPRAGLSYRVSSYSRFLAGDSLAANQCVVSILSAQQDIGSVFYSTGPVQDSVTVTADAEGKIAAAFNDVSLVGTSKKIQMLSGILRQP